MEGEGTEIDLRTIMYEFEMSLLILKEEEGAWTGNPRRLRNGFAPAASPSQRDCVRFLSHWSVRFDYFKPPNLWSFMAAANSGHRSPAWSKLAQEPALTALVKPEHSVLFGTWTPAPTSQEQRLCHVLCNLFPGLRLSHPVPMTTQKTALPRMIWNSESHTLTTNFLR